jgi:hypothetical protein
MNRRINVHLVAAAVVVLGLSLAADLSAGQAGLKAKGKARGPRAAATFSLSTQYTGYLGETIQIGSVRYPVAPTATVYVLGEGLVPLGMSVVNRSIYLSGVRHGKGFTVHSIVVRPAVSGTDDSGGCGKVTDPNPPM